MPQTEVLSAARRPNILPYNNIRMQKALRATGPGNRHELPVLVQQPYAFCIHGCAANHLRGTDDVATRGTSRTVTGQDGGREAGEQLRHRNQELSDVGRIAFDTFEWGCPVEAKLAAASAPERLKARAGSAKPELVAV